MNGTLVDLNKYMYKLTRIKHKSDPNQELNSFSSKEAAGLIPFQLYQFLISAGAASIEDELSWSEKLT